MPALPRPEPATHPTPARREPAPRVAIVVADLATKFRFLRREASYPGAVTAVEAFLVRRERQAESGGELLADRAGGR